MWDKSSTHDVRGLGFRLVEKMVDYFEVRQSPGMPRFVPVGVKMRGKEV